MVSTTFRSSVAFNRNALQSAAGVQPEEFEIAEAVAAGRGLAGADTVI
jgi:hypothetical protein